MELYIHSPIRLHGVVLNYEMGFFVVWYLIKHRDFTFRTKSFK